MINEYICLSCKNREDFFDEEVEESNSVFVSEEPCSCGCNKWKKEDANIHVYCGKSSYSYKTVRPDSIKNRDQYTVRDGEHHERRFYAMEFEKTNTQGNKEDT